MTKAASTLKLFQTGMLGVQHGAGAPPRDEKSHSTTMRRQPYFSSICSKQDHSHGGKRRASCTHHVCYERGCQLECISVSWSPHLYGNDKEEEHVGQHVGEALVQEPGGEPAVRLCTHERPPARAPHYQEVPSKQPGLAIIAPRHCLTGQYACCKGPAWLDCAQSDSLSRSLERL